MIKIDLTHGVSYIIDALHRAGFEAYTVGGSVRNSLLFKAVDDYDITTSASPDEVKSVFKNLRLIETGIKHGTVTVMYEGVPYEVTTYRVDGEYGDNRHPKSVEFTRRLEDDLARRDFTVNAMCYNDRDGLVDLYGGRADLENRIIRTVGDPSARFSEDALRILRALRFASVLNFEIDGETSSAIFNLHHLLANVSYERVLVELKKLLAGEGAHRILIEYSEVIRFVFPELREITLPERQKFLAADWRTRLITLFIMNAEAPAEALNTALIRLRSDNRTRLLLTNAINAYFEARLDTSGNILRGLMRFGDEAMRLSSEARLVINSDKSAREALIEVLEKGLIYKIRDLAVNGEDVQALGYHGSKIGEALERALLAVMDGECDNLRDELLSYLKK